MIGAVSKQRCQLQPSCVPSWAAPLSALRSHWGVPRNFNWGYFCQLHPPKTDQKSSPYLHVGESCDFFFVFWVWTFNPTESPVKRLLFLFRGWTRRSSTAWAMQQVAHVGIKQKHEWAHNCEAYRYQISSVMAGAWEDEVYKQWEYIVLHIVQQSQYPMCNWKRMQLNQ